MSNHTKKIINYTILVAALGYFVDIYDLLLFGIIRVPSLKSLGLDENQIKIVGENILMWQMVGLLIGGIIWGVMGDKKGRLSVLFGSILLYSLANFANGFVQNIEQYKWIRFFAGIGLAGELGAGITLVSELVSKEKRGLITSLVAGLGLTGAVVAFVFKQNFDWRTCYFIGGGMGIVLLMLRIVVFESEMFNLIKKKYVKRGDFLMLFTNKNRFKRYLLNILIGLPTWLCIGVFITFSKEFGEAMHMKEKIDPGKSIMYAYMAISIGDILAGVLSQVLKSRKKALLIYYLITCLFIALYFTILDGASANQMYFICAGIGLGTGFWAIFVTMAAEQFGTNLRATATTTIPNMVRGMLAVFIIPLFRVLQNYFSYLQSGWILAIIIMVISTLAVFLIEETFNKNLDFVEN
jgi:hypothetical protein